MGTDELATSSEVTRLIGKPRNDPELRPIFLAAYKEAIDVGRARGVALPTDAVDAISRRNQPDATFDEGVDGARPRAATGSNCPGSAARS